MESDGPSLAIKDQLSEILSFIRKALTAKPIQDLSLSPVPSDEEDADQDASSPTAYMSLLRFLLTSYPASLTPATPSYPAATFLVTSVPDEHARLPKMVLSSASRKAKFLIGRVVTVLS